MTWRGKMNKGIVCLFTPSAERRYVRAFSVLLCARIPPRFQ
jgi:hypothetical protein